MNHSSRVIVPLPSLSMISNKQSPHLRMSVSSSFFHLRNSSVANFFHPSMYSGQWVSTPYFNPAPPKKSSTHFCCLFFCSGVALIASHISVFALNTNSSRLIFPFLLTSRKLNMCLCRASHFGLSKSGSVFTSAYLLLILAGVSDILKDLCQ